LSWEQLPNLGAIPPGTAGATMVYLDHKLIVFGGVNECVNLTAGPGNTTVCAGNVFFNDIWIYDLQANTWSQPTITGTKPVARSFHRSVADPTSNAMYTYGGVIYSSIDGTAFVPLGDFWKFSLDTLTWTQITNTVNPGIRVDPGFTIKDNDIYLGFGLFTIVFPTHPEQVCKNDLWKYNIPSNTWTQLIANDINNPALPPVRYQCRFDYNKDHNKIILYGGDVLPDNTEPRYDTWSYDVDLNTWTLLDNNSMIPLFTGASATNGDVFLLSTGEIRFGTQVECTDPITGKKNNPVNDHYILQFTTAGSTYHQIYPTNNIPPAMQSAYTTNKKNFYLWGGFNFFCVSSGVQGQANHRAVQKYYSNIWTMNIPNNLY